MQFGVREICDVVLKAKATQKVGNKMFYKHEPVIYFDTLKTSTLEGAATTVYAQGGAGNPRLIAWEGERTITFTMEDALISPEGFMILSGAGLIEGEKAENGIKIKQHVTETIDASASTKRVSYTDTVLTIELEKPVYFPVREADDGAGVTAITAEDLAKKGDNYIYVMLMKEGEIISEPYVGTAANNGATEITVKDLGEKIYELNQTDFDSIDFDAVLVDYYTEVGEGAKQIEITADKFGGNYYLEASTLFRNTNGVDMPAEFIIPNCKIQSNFTFTMASSGDPSTFTFTMDAFPDYTRFDKSKKVLSAIQIISSEGNEEIYRSKTVHDPAHDDMID